MIWTNHHSVMDGWSLPMIMDKWMSICYGEDRVFDFVPFKTHVEWLAQQSVETSKAFWVAAMSNHEKTIPLALCKPFNNGSTSSKYASIQNHLHLPDMKATCKSLCVTPSSVFRAAWAILLSQYTRSEYVSFGAVVSGRDSGLDQVDQ